MKGLLVSMCNAYSACALLSYLINATTREWLRSSDKLKFVTPRNRSCFFPSLMPIDMVVVLKIKWNITNAKCSSLTNRVVNGMIAGPQIRKTMIGNSPVNCAMNAIGLMHYKDKFTEMIQQFFIRILNRTVSFIQR